MSSAWMNIWYDINVYPQPRIGEVAGKGGGAG
jgi:hypothetical protein